MISATVTSLKQSDLVNCLKFLCKVLKLFTNAHGLFRAHCTLKTRRLLLIRNTLSLQKKSNCGFPVDVSDFNVGHELKLNSSLRVFGEVRHGNYRVSAA